MSDISKVYETFGSFLLFFSIHYAEESDEISLSPGDAVRIVNATDDGGCTGISPNGDCGMFLVSCVEFSIGEFFLQARFGQHDESKTFPIYFMRHSEVQPVHHNLVQSTPYKECSHTKEDALPLIRVSWIQYFHLRPRPELHFLLDVFFFFFSDTLKDTCTSRTKTVKALYDYTAGDADELSFDDGDIITNVEDVDDGWAAGDCNGKHGLFPTNFVERI